MYPEQEYVFGLAAKALADKMDVNTTNKVDVVMIVFISNAIGLCFAVV